MYLEITRALYPVYQTVIILKDVNITDFYNSSGANILLAEALVASKNYTTALEVMIFEESLVPFRYVVNDKHRMLLLITIYENLDMINKATELWIASVNANFSDWSDIGILQN